MPSHVKRSVRKLIFSLVGIRSLRIFLFSTVTKFKERTRIAHYSGLPELMSMFKQIADIRTSDTLKLDVQDCEYKVVNVDVTEFQKELIAELSDRADAINSGNVDPTIDNMLKIMSDGRKLGLDPRLIVPSFGDNLFGCC